MKNNKIYVGLAIAATVLVACHNGNIEFPDFDYQTVYFASQYPVRTVELGEDLFVDNTLDNQHKVKIQATIGGVYSNKVNRIITFEVAPSLCDGFKFGGSSTDITPMPTNYYQLSDNKITIPSGSFLGGVEVQLTDAFFADPKSLDKNYVIPLLMKTVENADSILRGTASTEQPNRLVESDWIIKPRDYVLYAIKYVNPWHGNYLRRGVDVVSGTIDGVATNENKERKAAYIEQDEVISLTTNALDQCVFNVPLKDPQGDIIDCRVFFTVDDAGKIIVTAAPLDASANPQITVSGSGEFKSDSESFGGKPRDAIYVNYTYNIKGMTKGIKNDKGDYTTPPKPYDLTYTTDDIMVLRDRGIAPEYFTVVKK